MAITRKRKSPALKEVEAEEELEVLADVKKPCPPPARPRAATPQPIIASIAPTDCFIGVDVGTGSARACVVNATGDLLGHAAYPITKWQSTEVAYEQSTNEIWRSVCAAVRGAVAGSDVDVRNVKGIGFAATCSLAVFTHDTDEPVSVTGPSFDGDDHNVVLWMDRRSDKEAIAIDDALLPDPSLEGNEKPDELENEGTSSESETESETRSEPPRIRPPTKTEDLSQYFGGSISVEMALPKVLWLKKHMAPEQFERCQFYDLSDALDHLATGEARRPCGAACEQPFVGDAIGIDGTVKGWSADFFELIGLGELAKDQFKRVGGVCKHGKPLATGARAGYLCAKAATELGLPSGIAVSAGIIDAFAGWVGTVGAPVPNLIVEELPGHPFSRCAAIAGTSTCIVACTNIGKHKALWVSPNHWQKAYDPTNEYIRAIRSAQFVDGVWGPYKDFLLPGTYTREGGQPASGELLQYVIDTHPAKEVVESMARDAGSTVFEVLNALLEEMRVKANVPYIAFLAKDVFYYGDWFGNRSPIGDPTMTGSVTGPRFVRTAENLALYYHGAMEFLAWQSSVIINHLHQEYYESGPTFVAGSLAQNKLLIGLLAEHTRKAVILPRYPQAAVACGAAILAAQAAFPNTSKLWAKMEAMTKAEAIVRPNFHQNWTQNAGRLSELHKRKGDVFYDQSKKQQEYRRTVNEVMRRKSKHFYDDLVEYHPVFGQPGHQEWG